MKQKIIITGANGQLGSELKVLADNYPVFDFIFLSREDLSIADGKQVTAFFQQYRPYACINCAAYTAVDKAESEPGMAFQINGEGVGFLATASLEFNSRFIHISTDYVFDGDASAPYKEDAATNPQSVYGHSKLEGEKKALEANPDTVIIRTSWVYSEYGKNFVKTMLRLMKEKKELKVVNDQLGSPTYAADLADVILKIITKIDWHPGLYHFSNDGMISWFDFAMAIKRLTASECNVEPIPSSGFPTPAKRPAYSVFETAKIKEVFNVEGKPWEESLITCLQKIEDTLA